DWVVHCAIHLPRLLPGTRALGYARGFWGDPFLRSLRRLLRHARCLNAWSRASHDSGRGSPSANPAGRKRYWGFSSGAGVEAPAAAGTGAAVAAGTGAAAAAGTGATAAAADTAS